MGAAGLIADARPAWHRPERGGQEGAAEHGIDPDKQGQTIDASQVPGLREALLKALFRG